MVVVVVLVTKVTGTIRESASLEMNGVLNDFDTPFLEFEFLLQFLFESFSRNSIFSEVIENWHAMCQGHEKRRPHF